VVVGVGGAVGVRGHGLVAGDVGTDLAVAARFGAGADGEGGPIGGCVEDVPDAAGGVGDLINCAGSFGMVSDPFHFVQ